MAIRDNNTRFASAQTLTSSGASTNLLDFTQDRNIGIGEPMAVVITVTAIDATSADETYTVAVQADDNSGFSSAGTVVPAVTILRSVAVPHQAVIPIPPNLDTERYMRLSWTLGGTTPSITYTADLVPQSMIQNYFAYPDAFVVN
jgi:hypothetical protein